MPLSESLVGVRVLDFTRLVPGPFATLILADLGADVLKVEAPGGGDYLRFVPPLLGGMGARFRALNRSKRSVVVDLSRPGAAGALLRVAKTADVVVEGFRPGVMERLGLGFEAVGEVNPRTIYASISGYGQDGPYGQRAGHDLNFAALSGLLAEMEAAPGRPPQPLPTQLADLVGGGLFAVIAILSALRRRDRVKGPQRLDLSMTEGLLGLLGPELADLLGAGADRPAPGQGLLSGGLATYRLYETSDHRFLAVAALEPKFCVALGGVLGVETRPGDLFAGAERQQELAEQIGARIRQRSLAEWVARFEGVDACVEPVLRPEELADHPQHAFRGVFRRGEDGGVSLGGPVRTPCAGGAGEGSVPKLGEHTEEVFREVGLSDEEIAALGPAQ